MTIDLTLIVVMFLWALIGYLGRILIEHWFEKPSGELVVDTSDPETDKWFLKLYEPPKYAARKHIAKLKVSHRRLKEDEKWPEEK